jgi:hypothetical protein
LRNSFARGGLLRTQSTCPGRSPSAFIKGTPSRQHDYRGGWGLGFQDSGDLASVYERHAQICYDHVKSSVPLRGAKSIDASLATIGDVNGVSVRFENAFNEISQHGFIIDAKYVHWRGWARFTRVISARHWWKSMLSSEATSLKRSSFATERDDKVSASWS